MITGYWCDLHRGTATEVQARKGSRGIAFVCSDCWTQLADDERWKYGEAMGRALRVDLKALRRVLMTGRAEEP